MWNLNLEVGIICVYYLTITNLTFITSVRTVRLNSGHPSMKWETAPVVEFCTFGMKTVPKTIQIVGSMYIGRLNRHQGLEDNLGWTFGSLMLARF